MKLCSNHADNKQPESFTVTLFPRFLPTKINTYSLSHTVCLFLSTALFSEGLNSVKSMSFPTHVRNMGHTFNIVCMDVIFFLHVHLDRCFKMLINSREHLLISAHQSPIWANLSNVLSDTNKNATIYWNLAGKKHLHTYQNIIFYIGSLQ